MMKRLGDLIEILNGFAFKSSNYAAAGVRVIRITNVQKGEVVDDDPKYHPYIDEASRFLLKEGDILMSLTGNVGRVGRLTVELCPAYLNQRVACIRLKDDALNKNYLYHFLNSNKFEFDAIRNSSGIAQLNLSTKWLSEYKIPLPPLPVQKRIAEILDLADAYRQKTKALIDKYDELAQSIFLEMFGDPVTNPKGWDKRNIESISFKVTKGESPKWQGFEYMSEGVRFITSENVKLGYLSCEKDKFISEEFHDKLIRSQLRENDILVNLVGASIGRGGITRSEHLPANINQAVAKIELDTSMCNPIFILNQIITPQIQTNLIGNKVEGARANISLKNVRDIQLICPSITLQNKFQNLIENIDAQKRNLKKTIDQSETMFDCILQKAFKGELVSKADLEPIKEINSHA